MFLVFLLSSNEHGEAASSLDQREEDIDTVQFASVGIRNGSLYLDAPLGGSVFVDQQNITLLTENLSLTTAQLSSVSLKLSSSLQHVSDLESQLSTSNQGISERMQRLEELFVKTTTTTWTTTAPTTRE